MSNWIKISTRLMKMLQKKKFEEAENITKCETFEAIWRKAILYENENTNNEEITYERLRLNSKIGPENNGSEEI